jgi:CHAT domain-containing protein
LRKRYPVVHIASHFQFRPGNETASFLLLGDGSQLPLSELKAMPNVFGGVDLLTLSACNTAIGSPGADGREVEGFGVLAQRQGAKAVVATLWAVADVSTQALMQTFYRLQETEPDLSKVEALRQAQLSLLHGLDQITVGSSVARRRRQAPYAHPYYWAPFLLIGNWK